MSSPGDVGGVGDASIVAVGEGGAGVGDARVVVIVVMGRGVVGWVVVVGSSMQVVGCCQHKWWGRGGAGVMVAGIVSLTPVVGLWLWLWSWWWS